jgi:hypothetical protein
MMYAKRTAVFATQHGKEKIFKRPVWHGLGLQLITPDDIDTDQLGTFSGDIPRKASMKDTVLAKAKLGMELTNNTLAFANEGSFNPHPQAPFIACDFEIAVFVDSEKNIAVYEQIMTTHTNHAQLELSNQPNERQLMETELMSFLKRIGFPQHAVIVKTNIENKVLIYKGIQDYQTLLDTIAICGSQAIDAKIQLETDMRAHLNPHRQQALRKLAFKLVRRLQKTCPACATIGWGSVDVVRGLPCMECGAPTQLIQHEILSCVSCTHRLIQNIPNIEMADPQFCDYCNP